MKKFLVAASALAMTAGAAMADGHGVKIGVVLGYTGPIETLTGPMGNAADLAIAEANAAGNFFGGTIEGVRGDTTCVDSAAATAATERVVAEGVVAIVGGDCSGVTGAMLQNVARPNGVVMISPSATSPALSTAEDDGLFFRTAPSDARQGAVIAGMLAERGITEIAVTYTNNDYGKGLADSLAANFGGTITTSIPHEDGKADYSAEVADLASAGGEVLAVLGYLDQGGKGIIEAALDSGAYDTFVLGDGMIGASLPAAIGSDLDMSFGTAPGTVGDAIDSFNASFSAAGYEGDGPFRAESYDAAALIILAMQAAGSADRADIAANVLSVANAPGTEIMPGEIGKALEILANGGEVDYQGASNVELIGPGEAAGTYLEYGFDSGSMVNKGALSY